MASHPLVNGLLDRIAGADGNQTMWDFMTNLTPPQAESPQIARGEVTYIEPALALKWRGVGRIKASRAYMSSGGLDINSLVLMRPGEGEVNDYKRLHSRKDWVVGFLEPFPRTEQGKGLWKVISPLLFGWIQIMRPLYDLLSSICSLQLAVRLQHCSFSVLLLSVSCWDLKSLVSQRHRPGP